MEKKKIKFNKIRFPILPRIVYFGAIFSGVKRLQVFKLWRQTAHGEGTQSLGSLQGLADGAGLLGPQVKGLVLLEFPVLFLY